MRVWVTFIALLMVIMIGVGGAAAGHLGFYVPGDMNFPIVKLIINGEPKAPDVPPMVIDGRTMVPLRFIAETFGATVNWDQETYTVSVQFPKPSTPPDVAATPVTVIPDRPGDTTAPATPVTVTPITVTPVTTGTPATPVTVTPATVIPVVTQTPATPVTVVPVTPTTPATPVTVTPVTPSMPAVSGWQGPVFGPQNRKEPIIVGSPYFQQVERQALNLLLARDLEGYMLVCAFLTAIRETEHTGVDVNTGIANRRCANYSQDILTIWEAAGLVHEATHVWLKQRNYQSAGEKAEAFCNRAQKESLVKLGAPAWMIDSVERSLQTKYWEVPYEQRNW